MASWTNPLATNTKVPRPSVPAIRYMRWKAMDGGLEARASPWPTYCSSPAHERCATRTSNMYVRPTALLRGLSARGVAVWKRPESQPASYFSLSLGRVPGTAEKIGGCGSARGARASRIVSSFWWNRSRLLCSSCWLYVETCTEQTEVLCVSARSSACQ
ncbi:uncharacterized protein BKA78DRAFT_144368 [Phyllosticta capitalensis]|uniref:uncharacterized protein n=1 Tax=Phyllosticta capitalensis TaxID=121624 RepID=UPI003130F350